VTQQGPPPHVYRPKTPQAGTQLPPCWVLRPPSLWYRERLPAFESCHDSLTPWQLLYSRSVCIDTSSLNVMLSSFTISFFNTIPVVLCTLIVDYHRCTAQPSPTATPHARDRINHRFVGIILLSRSSPCAITSYLLMRCTIQSRSFAQHQACCITERTSDPVVEATLSPQELSWLMTPPLRWAVRRRPDGPGCMLHVFHLFTSFQVLVRQVGRTTRTRRQLWHCTVHVPDPRIAPQQVGRRATQEPA
jgi:hypothetical protein